jgi:hypothetical protein
LWIARKVEESTQFSFSAEEKKHFATLLMKAKVIYLILYNTLLNSNRLIGCLWSRDIE